MPCACQADLTKDDSFVALPVQVLGVKANCRVSRTSTLLEGAGGHLVKVLPLERDLQTPAAHSDRVTGRPNSCVLAVVSKGMNMTTCQVCSSGIWHKACAEQCR